MKHTASRHLVAWLFVLASTLVGCAKASMGPPPQAPGGGAYSATAESGGSGAGFESDEVSAEYRATDAPPAPAPAAPAAPEPIADRTSAARGAPPPPPAAMPVAKAAPGKDQREMERTGSTGGQPVASATTPAGKKSGSETAASQMLVYTANVVMVVTDVAKGVDAVEKLAKSRGGYLVIREDRRITVRVPSAKFDETLDALGGFGEVTHRNVSIEDVTDAYFDMQTRIKNLEVVKSRLEELLKKATTVSEALAVQRQLERVSSELESLRGKVKLLAELVMFSTITVTLEPRDNERVDSRVRLPFPWMDRLGLGELLRL
ncbi:MAG: DUF4349 domain-containing protein [Polyangiaceae bacterium]